MKFLSPLDVRALPDGKTWVLLKDLTVDLGFADGKDVIRIKAGFVTDFGSVPWACRLIVNPQGKAKAAFVLHDWLYANQMYNRLVSDALLNEGMEELQVSPVQCELVFRGLRLGGWWAYGTHRRARKKALAAGKPYPELMDLKKADRREKPRDAEFKKETHGQETKAE